MGILISVVGLRTHDPGVLVVPQGGMGAFSKKKYFLAPSPHLPQNNFKCFKISPNLKI